MKETRSQKEWVNTWLQRDRGGDVRAELGAAAARGRILEVGGENVLKFMQTTQCSIRAKMRKNTFFGQKYGKIGFGAFLTDDVSMTSQVGSSTEG